MVGLLILRPALRSLLKPVRGIPSATTHTVLPQGMGNLRALWTRFSASHSSWLPTLHRWSRAPAVEQIASRPAAGRLSLQEIKRIQTPDPELAAQYQVFFERAMRRHGFNVKNMPSVSPEDLQGHPRQVALEIFDGGEEKIGSVIRNFTADGQYRRMMISWVGSDRPGLGNRIYEADASFCQARGVIAVGKFITAKSEHLFEKYFPGAVTGLRKSVGYWIPV